MLTPESPRPAKSGATWKWIGFGCGGLVLMLLLIGTGLFIFVQRTLNFSFDAEKSATLAREIMDYQIPGGDQGFMSIDMAGVQFAGVINQGEPQEVVLVLGRMGQDVEGDFVAIQESLEESMNQQQGNFEVEEQRTESRPLCGQTPGVNIMTGQQTVPGGNPVPAVNYQTLVETDGFLYLVSLTTTGDEAEPLAEEIFASLNCR